MRLQISNWNSTYNDFEGLFLWCKHFMNGQLCNNLILSESLPFEAKYSLILKLRGMILLPVVTVTVTQWDMSKRPALRSLKAGGL